jgi:CDP-diacylglycerol---glycerol-3-phosphate 3-phosphatidyltransferase
MSDAIAVRAPGRDTARVVPVNVPNVLTMLRILAVPVLVVALLDETPDGDVIAAIVFTLAALTDGLDGWIARRREQVTTFGKLMDPLADKLLVIAALVSLVSLDRLAAWIAMVIIARELAVTGLRAVAAEQGVVIAASWLGKAKTLLQVAAIICLIAFDPAPWWVDGLLYLAVVVTLVSGADYFLGLRRHIERQDVDDAPAAPGDASPEAGSARGGG